MIKVWRKLKLLEWTPLIMDALKKFIICASRMPIDYRWNLLYYTDLH